MRRPSDDELVDLMIDLMVELEAIELSAQGMRSRLQETSRVLLGFPGQKP